MGGVGGVGGGRLRKLIIQKLHVRKYVYQYAKRRRKVGQNFLGKFGEGKHRLHMNEKWGDTRTTRKGSGNAPCICSEL